MQRTLFVKSEFKDDIFLAGSCKVDEFREEHNLISVNVVFDDFSKLNEFIYAFIARTFVKKFIYNFLVHEMIGFNNQEQTMIYNEILTELSKTKYINKISKITASSSIINLEGMFNFALSELKSDVKDLCHIKIDEHILRNEYLDFIRVLRFFSSVNYGLVDILHVVVRSETSADIYDNNFDVYAPFYGDKYKCEIAQINEFFEYDDLVTTLVEASPKNIVLHNWNNFSKSDMIETLINIFDERVSFCNGCNFCKG